MSNFKEAFLEYSGRFETYKIVMAVVSAGILAVMVNWVLMRKGFNCKRRLSVVSLTVYLFLIFSTTVFAREWGGEVRYKTKIFWSYRLACAGHGKLFWEIICNILMFLPIGFLLPKAVRNKKIMGLLGIIIFGCLCSLIIETLQLLCRCGLFEWDDVFSNTLGAVIGYFVFAMTEHFFKIKSL